MNAPQRIQRKRTRGWKMPQGAIYVGRPTRWGNPFVVNGWVNRTDEELWPYLAAQIPGGATVTMGAATFNFTRAKVTTREEACELHMRWLADNPPLWLAACEELAGHDLACWCPLDEPCHADLLLAIANPELVERVG